MTTRLRIIAGVLGLALISGAAFAVYRWGYVSGKASQAHKFQEQTIKQLEGKAKGAAEILDTQREITPEIEQSAASHEKRKQVIEKAENTDKPVNDLLYNVMYKF